MCAYFFFRGDFTEFTNCCWKATLSLNFLLHLRYNFRGFFTNFECSSVGGQNSKDKLTLRNWDFGLSCHTYIHIECSKQFKWSKNINEEIHQQMFRCKQDNIFQPFRPFSNPYANGIYVTWTVYDWLLNSLKVLKYKWDY